jgi:hypothetical protein
MKTPISNSKGVDHVKIKMDLVKINNNTSTIVIIQGVSQHDSCMVCKGGTIIYGTTLTSF